MEVLQLGDTNTKYFRDELKHFDYFPSLHEVDETSFLSMGKE